MVTNSLHPRLQHAIERHPALVACVDSINAAFEALKKSYSNNGQLLICGNGGSAADSDHIAGELLKGFDSGRPLTHEWKQKLGDELASKLHGALPTLPLPNFKGLLTAWNNDCDPYYAFAQLTWGLGRKGDVLLAISTSGNSQNILHAIKVAKAKEMVVIGLTGESGGKMKGLVDICICAPATWTPDIQEFHLPIYHVLCLMLEDHFFMKAPK